MGKLKQRGNGEGSVIRIKRDTRVRYAAELTVDWVQGKRIKKRGELRITKAEAQADLDRLKRQHARAVDVMDKQTVREIIAGYITHVIAPFSKARTVETYRWAEGHLTRAFGDTQARRLGRDTLQRYFSALTKQLAPKSIHLIYTVLNGALIEAVRNGKLDENPAATIKLPSIQKSKALFLTPVQARLFLAAAAGERLELAMRIALSLGLRRGEVAGLRWDDIDLDTGLLTVNGTMGTVRKQGQQYGTPKSESGVRKLRLPDTLRTALRQHQARQQAERRAMGDKWQDSPYVFVSVQTGGPMSSDRIYDAVKRVADRAGLPTKLSPHSLRHSCASFLYAEGVPEKAISAFLGHANTTITRELYVHLLGGELDDAAAHIERMLAFEPVPTVADEDDAL